MPVVHIADDLIIHSGIRLCVRIRGVKNYVRLDFHNIE